MKTIQRFLVLVLLILLQACKPLPEPLSEASAFLEGEKHFVILHPTVNNLKTFLFLKEKEIFPLPDEFRIVGIYHEKENYNFSQSAEFIDKEQHKNIALLKISADLNPENLYGEHEGTAIFRKIFEHSEGMIFFGGPDIPPAIYGEPMDLLTVVTDPNRHYLEVSLLFHLLGGFQNEAYTPFLEENPKFGILGICLGMQSMNVATGGAMVQDIPKEIYGMETIEEIIQADQQIRHRNYYTNYGQDPLVTAGSFHRVDIKEGHLARINEGIDAFPYVLSSHHQAVEKLGKGLKPTCWSMDGKVIEALEHEIFTHVLGVQFHPEATMLYQPEHKIRTRPLEEGTQSYSELYPAELGENFHRKFWKHIANWYLTGKE